jgi:hypothetical protein
VLTCFKIRGANPTYTFNSLNEYEIHNLELSVILPDALAEIVLYPIIAWRSHHASTVENLSDSVYRRKDVAMKSI